jgi:hypothetical protein
MAPKQKGATVPKLGKRVVSGDETGLMIIRTWIEKGSSHPLRAQIRASTDVSDGFDRMLTVARPEDVCATVEEWLKDILGDNGR